MAHSVQGYQYITFGWVMLWISFIAVVIRLYFRVFLYGNLFSRHSWRWAEIFVIIGWLLALATNICNSIANDVNGNNVSRKMTSEEKVIMLKAYWAWAFFYKPSIYAMKAALLCFYTELIDRQKHRKIWISIIAIAILNAMGCASQILYIAFQCIPFTLNWNPEPWSDFCRGGLPYQIITLTGHTVTDLLVFILPFFIIKYAMQKLSTSQKRGAFMMFGLGFINLGIAVILFITRMIALGPNNVPLKAINVSIDLLYTLQIATAIIIPCLPQLRLFWKLINGQFKSPSDSSPKIDIGPTRKYSISQSWSKSWRSRTNSFSMSKSRPSITEMEQPGAAIENNWYKYWRSPSQSKPSGIAEDESETSRDNEKGWSRYWRTRSDSAAIKAFEACDEGKMEVSNNTV